MASGTTRRPGKQGSWYLGDPDKLSEQLHGFLADVPDEIDGSELPIPGARLIIAPHAGYDYSGPTAAWAYKALDLSKAKRVFLLGPSHTYYLRGCAVTSYSSYGTPRGPLRVDEEVTARLRTELGIPAIPVPSDDREHSLEMHLPYLWLRLQQTFPSSSPDAFPPIVPVLVGDGDAAAEKDVGRWLAPYLGDPENAFVVSSDFCHWGTHFDYTVYSPDGDPATPLRRLRRHDPAPSSPPIHETIRMLDELAIEAIKTGSHDAFCDVLRRTKNTVCGRHPIGVTMAALEELGEGRGQAGPLTRFKFVQYRRSSMVTDPSDSSVSYVSAYAVL